MRIIAINGEFELPVGFKAPITVYSQIFNSEGEQSVPLTLPGSHRNLMIIRFPNRIDNLYKPLPEINVDVVDDIFMRPARMTIHTANETNGISCTLYFSEANFYAMIDDKTMQDIVLDKFEGIGTTHDEKVKSLITLLKNEYLNQNSEMYSVFPVKTEQSITRKIDFQGRDEVISYTETFNLVLNGFELANIYPFYKGSPYSVMLDTFMGESSQKFIADDSETAIAIGYGMTAFVNVFYFLKKMFTQFGYSFDDSKLRFFINASTGRVVMLNNVADAIYDAVLDLNQLVPSMTLKDFLTKMAIYLGGVWSIDEFEKKIFFFQYADLFKYNPGADLTQYMSSALNMNEADFKTIDIYNSANSSIKQKANTTYLEVSLPAESNYVMSVPYLSREQIVKQWAFTMKLMAINNIIHLNSSIVKESKIDTEKETYSSNELILAAVRKGVLSSEEIRYGGRGGSLLVTIKYYRCFSSIYRNSDNALEFMRAMYQAYIDWNLNSNITVSCDTHMPPAVLYSIDMLKQYVFEGQLFFIDKIEHSLPYDGNQKLTLKTIRAYEDNV